MNFFSCWKGFVPVNKQKNGSSKAGKVHRRHGKGAISQVGWLGLSGLPFGQKAQRNGKLRSKQQGSVSTQPQIHWLVTRFGNCSRMSPLSRNPSRSFQCGKKSSLAFRPFGSESSSRSLLRSFCEPEGIRSGKGSRECKSLRSKIE